jgi:hypothetical protein
MRGINLLMLTFGAAILIGLAQNQLVAQDTQGGGRQRQRNNQGGGRQNQGNLDPAQLQQRMLERYKERLEVTDENEWKAMQPLVQKVMDARAALAAGGRGAFGRGGRPGNDPNPSNQNNQGRSRTSAPANPAAETLQKAVDAKAPAPEMKAALTKYLEYRKGKQAELEKAQQDLRGVLTSRQEAIAVLSGLL